MAISTYVAVPTLAVGDKLTASRWNTIGTALGFLLNPPEAVATNTASTSILNNTLTTIPFATETKDTGGTWDGAMHDNVTNNSRVTITTTGTYQVSARISWTANATGRRTMQLNKNGTGIDSIGIANPGASDPAICYHSAEYNLTAGDYLEIQGIQTSGGALTLTANGTYLQARLIGS